MEIIADTTEFWLEGSAIAIGKFDGIHKGHTALLSHILKQKENGQKAVVFTFPLRFSSEAAVLRKSRPVRKSGSCLRSLESIY